MPCLNTCGEDKKKRRKISREAPVKASQRRLVVALSPVGAHLLALVQLFHRWEKE